MTMFRRNRVRMSVDVKRMLDQYLVALEEESVAWESHYAAFLYARVFPLRRHPDDDVFTYLILRALLIAEKEQAYVGTRRTSRVACRALAHPDCPEDMLVRALTSSNAEYRRIAQLHPDTPEAATVAAALSGWEAQ